MPPQNPPAQPRLGTPGLALSQSDSFNWQSYVYVLNGWLLVKGLTGSHHYKTIFPISSERLCRTF